MTPWSVQGSGQSAHSACPPQYPLMMLLVVLPLETPTLVLSLCEQKHTKIEMPIITKLPARSPAAGARQKCKAEAGRCANPQAAEV